MTTQLTNAINCIRDILRSEGLTGMDSLDHCVIFMVFRMFDAKTCERLNINKKNTFDNFLKQIANRDIEDDIYKNFVSRNKDDDSALFNIVNKFKFTTLKFKLQDPKNLIEIIKKIKDLDMTSLSNKCDIVGVIYELHLKTGAKGSGMRDLGQFYTNRLVIDYMIRLCEPKNTDSIIDPTCGTAGFLSMAIKYLNDKDKNIDWNVNKNNIRGYDIDEHIVNLAILNLFMETGEIFTDCITQRDTLKQDFSQKKLKYDVILANEPMGIKQIKYDQCCERIKDLKVSGTKAEPLFLQLFMQAMEDNGRCAVIVPDGVLFNESNLHSSTRKYLIENFNLKKVIALNDDFFLNTGVKTSILFFTKENNKTKRVEFCEIKIKDGEIEETSIIKVKYNKIKEANYSLFVKKYNAMETEKIEGIEYKKFGDICNLLPTTKHTSSIGKDKGLYRFYNSSQEKTLYLDTYEVDEESIIIGNGGNLCIHYDKTFTPSKHVTVCQTAHKNINLKYIYYHLTLNSGVLKEKSAGSTIQWLNKTSINSIEIPCPSLAIQESIVERLDVLNSNNETCKKNIDEFRKIIKYYVDCQTNNEKEYKLGEICDITIGGTPKRDNADYWNGTNIWISVSELNNNILIDSKEKITDKGVNNSNVKLVEKGSVLMSFKMSLGKKAIAGTNLYTNEAIATINTKKKTNCNKFIYYFIDLFDFSEACSSIGVGNLNKEKLYNLKIKIPSKEKQKEIVKYCDNLSDMIAKLEQQIKDNKELMKQIMVLYLNQKEDLEENKEKGKKYMKELEDASEDVQDAVAEGIADEYNVISSDDGNSETSSTKKKKKVSKDKKTKKVKEV